MKHNKRVSFVLGSYNRLPYLILTLDSIRAEAANIEHEIIIIDGGSTDGSIEWLVHQKDVITIIQHNRGEWLGKAIPRRSWGYFMNLGFKAAQGEYVCMLSDDSLLIPGAVSKGLEYLDTLRAQGKKVGAGAFYFRDWSRNDYYQVGHSLGGMMYVNHGLYVREALKDVDFIDEEFFFYNGDSDLCLRMWQKGYEVVACPDSYVEHYPHANVTVRNTNYDRFNADRERYFKKWDGIYYDLAKHDLGFWEQKEFVDETKTGDRYARLHEEVVKANAFITKKPTPMYRLAQRVKWKYEAVQRKWQLMWR
jgi:GT2 family glycosyltransferase